MHPPSNKDINKKLYDYDDQIMIVNDWSHLDGNGAMVKTYYDRQGKYVNTILVNGFGRFVNQQTKKSTLTPLAVFKVTKVSDYMQTAAILSQDINFD